MQNLLYTTTGLLVLIEILWNVKCFKCSYCVSRGVVLIERLWNVKRENIRAATA